MTLSLIVRKKIYASRARLFDAWITPAHLLEWWGPEGVRCSHAEVDARVGGQLRIGNVLPDGSTLWILGEFLEVIPPERLVFTWRTEPSVSGGEERVTVQFEAHGDDETEVIVIHERIANEAFRAGHNAGWEGCLDGLAAFTQPTAGSEAPHV